MFKYLVIDYGKNNELSVRYRLRDTAIVPRWIDAIRDAQQQNYVIDQPDRFYGFGDYEEECQSALLDINTAIAEINKYEKICLRNVDNLHDQKGLNYLHNIFEKYHGLLDQQDTEWWQAAPEVVHRALANLNILVHRCESLAHGPANPRHVVTYFGLPKTRKLEATDYQLFETEIVPGTVYLNYVEIGKTLFDLAHDNDEYIGDDAFQPWQHYSADFNVKFWQSDAEETFNQRNMMLNYYERNTEFVNNRGYHWDDAILTASHLPVADLEGPIKETMQQISQLQWVNGVRFE